MPNAQPNLFTRDDTFFGVCEALGEDIGVHSNWLRLAFAGAFFFSPVAVVSGYFVLGLVVVLSRWIAPSPARPQPIAVAVVVAEAAEQHGNVDPREPMIAYPANETDPLPMAA